MLKNEFRKYPNVYRSQTEKVKSAMTLGMAFIDMFLAIVALAVLYSMLYQGGSGVTEGARLRALRESLLQLGLFVVLQTTSGYSRGQLNVYQDRLQLSFSGWDLPSEMNCFTRADSSQ